MYQRLDSHSNQILIPSRVYSLFDQYFSMLSSYPITRVSLFYQPIIFLYVIPQNNYVVNKIDWTNSMNWIRDELKKHDIFHILISHSIFDIRKKDFANMLVTIKEAEVQNDEEVNYKVAEGTRIFIDLSNPAPFDDVYAWYV